MLKLINLQAVGMNFLMKLLPNGDYLAKGLLRTATEGGFVYTHIPEQVDFTKISLEHGGLDTFEHDDNLREPLVHLAQGYLSDPTHLMMAEIPQVQDSQPLSKLLSNNYFRSVIVRSSLQGGKISGTEETQKWWTVYGFLNSSDQTGQNIQELIDIAGNVVISLTVLTSVEGLEINLQHGQEVSSDLITTLGQCADYAYLGAYDGESHVIWSRHPLAESQEAA